MKLFFHRHHGWHATESVSVDLFQQISPAENDIESVCFENLHSFPNGCYKSLLL